jgi:hypothetical protein
MYSDTPLPQLVAAVHEPTDDVDDVEEEEEEENDQFHQADEAEQRLQEMLERTNTAVSETTIWLPSPRNAVDDNGDSIGQSNGTDVATDKLLSDHELVSSSISPTEIAVDIVSECQETTSGKKRKNSVLMEVPSLPFINGRYVFYESGTTTAEELMRVKLKRTTSAGAPTM